MSSESKKIIQNLSIDCVVFGFENSELSVLLIKRNKKPQKDMWALPGGFIYATESLDEAAIRILAETSNVKNIYLEQVHTFSEVDRFPDRRVISSAYFALINPDKHQLHPGLDSSDVQWFSIKNLPQLPFDHKKIFDYALKQLQKRVRYKPLGFELLPRKFTLTQLQHLYESILGIELDKRNFRKKILGTKILIQLDEYQKGVAHRAPRLYKFDTKNYNRLKKMGINFEL